MRKGVSKIRQFVLAQLKAKGRPLTAVELAGAVYSAELDLWTWKQPTSAQLIAVRRAIHALEKAGLLRCGLIGAYVVGMTITGELCCWLPDQMPPKGLKPSKKK